MLVGPMASGKTTVGTMVAERLGRPLVDSDDQIHATTGRTVAEIAAADGIDRVHELERVALCEGLERRPPPVIAAAASVVDDPTTSRRLASAFVVWLRTPPEVVAARVAGGDHRPDALERPAALERLADERDDRYAEVADLVLDTPGRTPEALAERIVAEVTGR